MPDGIIKKHEILLQFKTSYNNVSDEEIEKFVKAIGGKYDVIESSILSMSDITEYCNTITKYISKGYVVYALFTDVYASLHILRNIKQHANLIILQPSEDNLLN